MLRSPEPSERLVGVDRAAAGIDDRLHRHREAPAFDQAVKRTAGAAFAGAAERAAGVGGDLSGEPTALGDAQGDVGGAQQRFAAVAVGRRPGYADARGDRSRIIRGARGKCLQQCLGKHNGIGGMRDHSELVSA